MTETFKGFMIGLLFGVAGTVCLYKRYYEHVIEETIKAEREQAEKDAEQAREEAADENAEHYYNEMRLYNDLVDKYGVGVAKDIKLSREEDLNEDWVDADEEEEKEDDEDNEDRSVLDFVPDDREYKGYMDVSMAKYPLDILDIIYGNHNEQNEHYWEIVKRYADEEKDASDVENRDTIHIAWGILVDTDVEKPEPLYCDHKAYELNGYQPVKFTMYTDDIVTNENGNIIPEELKPILLPEDFDTNLQYSEKEDAFVAYFINPTLGISIRLLLKDYRYDEEEDE